MKALFTGIYSLFNAGGDLKTNLTGGLHLGEAPQGTATPYGVFFLVSNMADWTFAENFEESLVQFDLYSGNRSAATICTLQEYLQSLYDNCKLTISGATHLYMWREFSRLVRDQENSVWQYTTQYRIRQQG